MTGRWAGWILAVVGFVLTVAAAVRWEARHPLPIYWDEANYINQTIVDHRLLVSDGLVRMVKEWIFGDPQRPPAYRIFGQVVSFGVGPTLMAERVLSLAMSIVAMLVLWSAARSVAPAASSALAVAVVFAMPGILAGAAWYGTEFSLYLATALLLDAILRGRTVELAAAVAIGCLAKATFFVIAGPAILMTLVLDRRSQVLLGTFCGALVAAPWWFFRWRTAYAYAVYGSGGTRWSVPFTLTDRAREFFMNGIGVAGFFAVLLLLAGVGGADERARRAIRICLAASLPLLIFAVASRVFVARHFSPAFLPLAVALAVAGSASFPRRVLAGALVLVQAGALVLFMPQLLPSVEQIDWSFLRSLAPGRKPVIAYIGGFEGMSPPELRYAWLRYGDDAKVLRLWSAEEPPIDFLRVARVAETSDVVIIVSPNELARTRGMEREDNRFNGELLSRLAAGGRFDPPRRIVVGQVIRREIVVLTRHAQPPPSPPPAPQTSRN